MRYMDKMEVKWTLFGQFEIEYNDKDSKGECMYYCGMRYNLCLISCREKCG
jgi:hypothetical protein